MTYVKFSWLVFFVLSGQVGADTYSDGWGPAVGESFPVFKVKNHANIDVTLVDLAGERGALLFMNRSAVW